MPSEFMICLQTWADWKKIPIFYFMYDWLLGLLEDALSPFERPHSITITAAWQHMLCVAILGSGIFLVAACRLAWLLLVYCCKGKTLDCTPSFALGSLLYMWSSRFSLPKRLTSTCVQKDRRRECKFSARDVANGLCHVPLAAYLCKMRLHVGSKSCLYEFTELNFVSVGSQLPPRTLNIFNQSKKHGTCHLWLDKFWQCQPRNHWCKLCT